MAVDPMIARGVTPLGEGLVQTLALAKQTQMEQQRANDFSARTQLDQEQFRAGQLSAEKQAELRERYSEMMMYDGAPPEIKGQYVASQAARYPNFAQTPFAKMPPDQAFAAMKRGLEAAMGQTPTQAPGPIQAQGVGGATFYTQDGKVVGSQMPERPQRPDAGTWSAPFDGIGPDGKPGKYTQNSVTGQVRPVGVAPMPKSGDANATNPTGLNERQLTGMDMQRENALSYAANLTGLSREEIERIYAAEGGDGVARVMLEKGERPLQGKVARWLTSMPLGKTYVEAENADLLPQAKGGGAGIALTQNPTGPITVSDFTAGEAQFPSPVYPLKNQAEMVKGMLRNSERARGGAAPTQAAADSLAQYAGQVIKQGGKRYLVVQGADGKYFAQELK